MGTLYRFVVGARSGRIGRGSKLGWWGDASVLAGVGLALLLLAGVVGVGAWLIGAAAEAALAYRIGAWTAVGMLSACGFVGAFRLAVLGTIALKQVLARNLAIVIAMELHALRVAARQQAVLLSAAGEGSLGAYGVSSNLHIPRFFGDRAEMRELLGPATERTLEDLLDQLQRFNAATSADTTTLRTELELVLFRLEHAFGALAPFTRAPFTRAPFSRASTS